MLFDIVHKQLIGETPWKIEIYVAINWLILTSFFRVSSRSNQDCIFFVVVDFLLLQTIVCFSTRWWSLKLQGTCQIWYSWAIPNVFQFAPKSITKLKKHTLLFEEFEGTFNGAVLSLVCLGPITPAVAIWLFPFALSEDPPFSVMDAKDAVLFDVSVGIIGGGRIKRGSSISASSPSPSSKTRIYFHNLSSWSRGNFGNKVRPIFVINNVSLL